MNAMLDRVEDASRRQQRFAADASHELRSPLTRMRSEVEVDMAHPDVADLDATQRSVLEEIDGLERLIDDLLHLARSDAGTLALDDAELDINEIVEREVEHAEPGSTVVVHFEGSGPAWVAGDPRALGRAIGNLLDNAIRHARAQVDVRVLAIEGGVQIVVADDGPGIPAASRDSCSSGVTRLDEARTAATGGTGLGLAIVRDIVQRHGGSRDRVEAARRGSGARFVVSFRRSADGAARSCLADGADAGRLLAADRSPRWAASTNRTVPLADRMTTRSGSRPGPRGTRHRAAANRR